MSYDLVLALSVVNLGVLWSWRGLTSSVWVLIILHTPAVLGQVTSWLARELALRSVHLYCDEQCKASHIYFVIFDWCVFGLKLLHLSANSSQVWRIWNCAINILKQRTVSQEVNLSICLCARLPVSRCLVHPLVHLNLEIKGREQVEVSE